MMLWIIVPLILFTLFMVAWIWREAINQKRMREAHEQWVREQRAIEFTRRFIDVALIEYATERTGIVSETPQEAIQLIIEDHFTNESERM